MRWGSTSDSECDPFAFFICFFFMLMTLNSCQNRSLYSFFLKDQKFMIFGSTLNGTPLTHTCMSDKRRALA